MRLPELLCGCQVEVQHQRCWLNLAGPAWAEWLASALLMLDWPQQAPALIYEPGRSSLGKCVLRCPVHAVLHYQARLATAMCAGITRPAIGRYLCQMTCSIATALGYD